MELSEFLQIMHGLLGDGLKPADFIVALIGNMTEEPEDKNISALDYTGDSLKRIFEGTLKLSKNKATSIRSRLDAQKLETYLGTFPEDTTEKIANKLSSHGFNTESSDKNVASKCCDLLDNILQNIIHFENKGEALTTTNKTVNKNEKQNGKKQAITNASNIFISHRNNDNVIYNNEKSLNDMIFFLQSSPFDMKLKTNQHASFIEWLNNADSSKDYINNLYLMLSNSKHLINDDNTHINRNQIDELIKIIEYIKKLKERYGKLKNLLFSTEPVDFYSFYETNSVKYRYQSDSMNENVLSNYRVEKGGHRNPIKTGYDKNDKPSVKSFRSVSQYIIITGTGGLGKSMMMRHLLLDAIENFQNCGCIPIMILLKDYSKDSGSIFEHIKKILHDENTDISNDSLIHLLKKGSFLLLFDGLDEIKEKEREDIEKEFNKFVSDYNKNQFIISSRPYQNFISLQKFSVVNLMPFSKKQACSMINKLVFRPDHPEIKNKFMKQLDDSLFESHKTFAENPLLLTIMLMTFERFADVPTKMHLFYQQAFDTLAVTHDSSKGAYKRALRTGFAVDEISEYFSEFCFRTYFNEKFELTKLECADYCKKMKYPGRQINIDDFLFDMCNNLCIMFNENTKYHFIHRSFQEYFCALFLSQQDDSIIAKWGETLDEKTMYSRSSSDAMVYMLYDMMPEKFERHIILPYLSKLTKIHNDVYEYWKFLTLVYPNITWWQGESVLMESLKTESRMYYIVRRIYNFPELRLQNKLPYEKQFEKIEFTTATQEKSESSNKCWLCTAETQTLITERDKYNSLVQAFESPECDLMKEYKRMKNLHKKVSDKLSKRKSALLDLL